MNNINKSLTIGKFTMHPEFDIPVVEILVEGNVAGYMTPFRGYFFQVSGTYDGECDLGESINYGRKLKSFITNNDDVDIDIFKSLALTCLIDFSRIWGAHHKGENYQLTFG